MTTHPTTPGESPDTTVNHVAGVDASGSTTITGAPAQSDRNSLTAGADGPIMLQDVHFVEQMAHFDRERVPERVVHAKGSGAFGYLEVTEDVSAYTKAAVFQPGARTEMLARFSTVAGELGSPDTWRDPRGFALKFYTTEGNLDIVGNNTPIFFIRDAMKFPHFIRSQKRRGASGLRDNSMQWDFWSLNPESAHQVTYLMGDRGIPATYRHQNGYGSHTYMWINAEGEKFWVKYHFISQQGVETLTNEEADRLAGTDADAHRRDLFEAIERGDFPKWDMYVQVIPFEEGFTYRYNIFDVTKTVSQKDYPRIKVGTFTLDKNPVNHFAQIEQAAFDPSALVPGTGLSPDKMLLGRVFSYADTHRHRIGANYLQLPVNRPHNAKMNTYAADGPMAYDHNGDAAPYAPNSEGRPFSDNPGASEDSFHVSGDLVRRAQTIRSAEDDDFTQARDLLMNIFSDEQRDRFVQTVAGHIAGVSREDVAERAFQYWANIDEGVAQRIREAHAALKA
ncbi:catalase [Dermabacteraceae bacterium TAE3-ERU27]|nr:catalase [Dermabacteraceae bacterium TAE3-ERU27]